MGIDHLDGDLGRELLRQRWLEDGEGLAFGLHRKTHHRCRIRVLHHGAEEVWLFPEVFLPLLLDSGVRCASPLGRHQRAVVPFLDADHLFQHAKVSLPDSAHPDVVEIQSAHEGMLKLVGHVDVLRYAREDFGVGFDAAGVDEVDLVVYVAYIRPS